MLGLAQPPVEATREAGVELVDPGLFSRVVAEGSLDPQVLVPDLVRALGLPHWASDHLLGHRPLSSHAGATTVEPTSMLKAMWRGARG